MTTLIIECSILALLLAQMTITIYIGSFIVRMKEEQKEFFSDLVDFFGEMKQNEDVKRLPTKISAAKTWDQKYEDELDMLSRRNRQDSGLVDPDRQK